jgi:hypothetical protein
VVKILFEYLTIISAGLPQKKVTVGIPHFMTIMLLVYLVNGHFRHNHLNVPDVTIITDRCKGSIAVIDEYFPNAVQFHCSYHCTANILLNCKGGKSKESPYWLYRQLVNCGSTNTLNFVRDKYGGKLMVKQLRYLNDVADINQYPAARCAMGHKVYTYMTTRHHLGWSP